MKGVKYKLDVFLKTLKIKKLFKIYDYFGLDNQMDKLKEELQELIDAIEEKNTHHIIEEMADVIIVLAQIVLFGLVWSEFKELCMMIEMKLKRTRKRIKSDYYKYKAEIEEMWEKDPFIDWDK